MVFSFALIGCVPHERLRRWMNDGASLIAFRIIARSISAVINFHNEEYKPKNCGFCVANHTSPIDVAILAADCTYSLVRQRHISDACTLNEGCLCPLCHARSLILRRGIYCSQVSCLQLIQCSPFSFIFPSFRSTDCPT